MPSQKTNKAKKLKQKPSLGKVGKRPVGAVAQCKKPALVTGVIATYGDLQKKTGDGSSDRDHIPSYKALEKRAAILFGAALNATQKGRIKRAGIAIVLPKTVHRQGRTYGGKNNATQTDDDALDLVKAAKLDIQAYKDAGVSAPLLTKMRTMTKTKAGYDTLLSACF
jgi:hypothetical protein